MQNLLARCVDNKYSIMFQAYLTLFSGLSISAVAEFYSIMGLIAIYPAAFWPIVIMGAALGIGKLTGTIWLKQNWERAPLFLKGYLLPAVFLLMFITSIGVFGFLSKAHSDQSLVSGDVQAKLAIYDEKIKTAKENIEANRRQLKQMDEAVDQVMARSTDEKGADKSNAIRRSQQRDRVALAKDIEANQKLIATLNDEAAPIRAEVRKVEAEVGPIKYIAQFIYGDNADANVLEKAVTWVSILIVIVLDPLAVILLLASQYSFQTLKTKKLEPEHEEWTEEDIEQAAEESFKPDAWVADVGEKPTAEEVKEESILDKHPYLQQKFSHFEGIAPMVAKPEEPVIEYEVLEDVDDEIIEQNPYPYSMDERPGDYVSEPVEDVKNLVGETEPGVDPVERWNKMLEEATRAIVSEPVAKKKLSVENKEYISIDGKNYYFNSFGGRRPEIRSAIDLAKELMKTGEYELVHVPAGISKEEITGVPEVESTGTYVQNEEQTQSDKWTKIIGKSISEEEYLEAARQRQESKGA